MKKILLSGYMAAGKSTTGRLLAIATGFTFIDLDDHIALREGLSVPEIFAQKGEIHFRKLEHICLKELMDDNQGEFVLALGGGTPCYANNHEFLKRDDVLSIYLQVTLPELVKRLEGDRAHRPLLKKNLSGSELQEFIAMHLFERSYFYNQSKHTIRTQDKSPEAIVNEIMSLF